MIDGFWILRIERPEGTGGVVLFTKGRIFGGDNAFAWTGAYEEIGTVIKGRIGVHHFDRTVPSIFGIDGDYELHISGNAQPELITGTALIANQPKYNLGFRLTKMANL